MTTVAESKCVVPCGRALAWVPLATLPAAAMLMRGDGPPWVLMWSLAVSVYAGLKWLTLAESGMAGDRMVLRRLGYLLVWPGMDARAFLRSPGNVPAPELREWLSALTKTALGLLWLLLVVPLARGNWLLAGWIGMTGIALVLHFGLFHLLSLAWRRAGVNAPPIMNSPLNASSLGDFWGRRWNKAFRDLVYPYVFRQLAGPVGVSGATMAAFLVSGAVHDLVISAPAGAGFGLPTLYFGIQGAGLLVEKSAWGKRIGLASGTAGRLFCLAVTVAPLGLLFHRPFVERVVTPMLADILAL